MKAQAHTCRREVLYEEWLCVGSIEENNWMDIAVAGDVYGGSVREREREREGGERGRE